MERLARIAAVLIIPMFWLIVLVTFGKMIEKSFLAAVLFLPLVIALGFFYKRRLSDSDRFDNVKRFIAEKRVAIWIGMQILSIAVMSVFLIKMYVNPSWDWGTVVDNASDYVLKGPEAVDIVYFSRYPNNMTWLMILVGYFKAVKFFIPNIDSDGLVLASAIMSAVFCQITIFLTYVNARQVLKNEFKAFIVGCFAITALPIYMYAQECYTDTIAMVLVELALYLFLKLKNDNSGKKHYVFLILISVVAALLFKIKILAFIVVIAMWLTAFLQQKKFKAFIVYNVIGLVIFAGAVALLNLAADKTVEITAENKMKYEFPMVHWVMMGMNDYGGYLEDDVVFTKKAGDLHEKQEADLNRLKARINDKGIFGTARHLFFTKLSRTWGNSLLAADDYASRNPVLVNGLMQKVFGAKGKYHGIILFFSWLSYFAVIVGVFMEALLAFNNKEMNNQGMVLRYSIYGVALFLTLWECNSRYLLPFYPLLIILCVSGWGAVKDIVCKKELT